MFGDWEDLLAKHLFQACVHAMTFITTKSALVCQVISLDLEWIVHVAKASALLALVPLSLKMNFVLQTSHIFIYTIFIHIYGLSVGHKCGNFHWFFNLVFLHMSHLLTSRMAFEHFWDFSTLKIWLVVSFNFISGVPMSCWLWPSP